MQFFCARVKRIGVFCIAVCCIVAVSCTMAANFSSVSSVNAMKNSFFVPSLAAYNKTFPRAFKVWSPSVHHHMLTLKYGCPLRGPNVSPAIAWRNIPKRTTRLYLDIVDGFCTWGCDNTGKAYHWILDFPVTAMQRGGVLTPTGIKAGAAKTAALRKYTYPNAMGKRGYLGMCSPVGQPHAWVIRLVAYRMSAGKVIVTGKSQSVPFLFPRSELKR